MNDKVVGYILLFTGIIIILFSAYSVISVFTKQSQPIDLFSFSGISIDSSNIFGTNLSNEVAQLLKRNNPQSNPIEIIKPEMLNDSLNIFSHLMLMGFLGGVGQKIAVLGVMLIRPIEVKMKIKETP